MENFVMRLFSFCDYCIMHTDSQVETSAVGSV